MRRRDGVVYYCEIWNKTRDEVRLLVRRMLEEGFWEFFGVKFCEGCVRRGEFGKPYYLDDRGFYFNVSHCKDGVAVAVSYFPVGVDVESMRKVRVGTVRKCCGDEEWEYVLGGEGLNEELSDGQVERFLRVWTLKESYVKMTGEGLRMPVAEIGGGCLDFGEKVGEGVWEVKRRGGIGRHYLCLKGKLIMALSVEIEDEREALGVAWKEYGRKII